MFFPPPFELFIGEKSSCPLYGQEITHKLLKIILVGHEQYLISFFTELKNLPSDLL